MEYADEPRLVFSPVTEEEYCDFYNLEMQDYTSDVPFYTSLLQPGDRVLELGCGNGRITRLLAPFCRRITGIDISGAMIRQAKSATSATPNTQTNIFFEQKDMLDFFFSSAFDVILIPYNTLNLLTNEGNVLKCLRLCREHLVENGHLGMQLYHPDSSILFTNESQKIFQFAIMKDGFGGQVIKETLKHYHSQSFTLHLEERYRVRPASGKGPNRDLNHTHALFSPQLPVWNRLLFSCGFQTKNSFSSAAGEPFKSERGNTLFIEAITR